MVLFSRRRNYNLKKTCFDYFPFTVQLISDRIELELNTLNTRIFINMFLLNLFSDLLIALLLGSLYPPTVLFSCLHSGVFGFAVLTVQNFSSVQSLIHFICIKTFHSFVLDRNLLFFHHFLAEMTHKCIDCSRSFLMRLIFRSTSFCSGHHFFAVAYRLIFACQ